MQDMGTDMNSLAVAKALKSCVLILTPFPEAHWKVKDSLGLMSPDEVGWCFEGYHTENRDEAAFLEDADEDDDKLESCEEAQCSKIQRNKGGKQSGDY